MSDTTPILDELFKAGAHFGYSRTRRHPSVKPFIFGVKNQVEIIDLEKTAKQLEKALEFVVDVKKRGKQILFVGTKSEAAKAVKAAAEQANSPYMTERWIGGLLTNFDEIRKRINRFIELRDKEAHGELSMYTKKERGRIAKEIKDLERYFAGVVGLTELPGALFVIDPRSESIAVAEAQKLGIPVVAVASSDCDITTIDHPVVANDSSQASIAYFARAVSESIKHALVTK